jgi:hypothetical protein
VCRHPRGSSNQVPCRPGNSPVSYPTALSVCSTSLFACREAQIVGVPKPIREQAFHELVCGHVCYRNMSQFGSGHPGQSKRERSRASLLNVRTPPQRGATRTLPNAMAQKRRRDHKRFLSDTSSLRSFVNFLQAAGQSRIHCPRRRSPTRTAPRPRSGSAYRPQITRGFGGAGDTCGIKPHERSYQ